MLTACVRHAARFYAWLLRLYPPDFRAAFAAEMRLVFTLALLDAARHGPLALLVLCGREFGALGRAILAARWSPDEESFWDTTRNGMMIDPALDEPVAEPQPTGSGMAWLRTTGREFASTILMAVVLYAVINLLIPRYIVEGSSMQPSFYDGDRIVASNIPYLFDSPQRGDVIILDRPAQPEDLIKRIIGLPGETVTINNGRVYVNDVPLDEPYINAPPDYHNRWVLGPDEYFVLGDNRNRSNDSHAFGPVSREEILARVLVVYWPPQDWGLVPAPDYGRNVSVP
ncbi:MAG: signal peptidase I, partial [Anaerolineae bacterium]|nr:signal peptidase I [Anaerolineae bacterium]